MTQTLTRRELLKLLSILPPAVYLPARTHLDPGKATPNFLILVFDAWSAMNTSLYGYPRATTPNLSRLAEKAIVYHNHYAGGHFTYPGTATLLTGVHPWSHRGYGVNEPPILAYKKSNLFTLFDSHNRLAYTHNTLADALIATLTSGSVAHTPRQELFLNDQFWLSKLLEKDYDTASLSWVRTIKQFDDGYANSLFFSRLYSLFARKAENRLQSKYPGGLPSVEGDNYFLLETAIDWIISQTGSQSSPYLAYVHLLPPHAPYHTRKEFYKYFLEDGYSPISKPEHPFSLGLSQEKLDKNRRQYDEFMLLVDSEIGRLFDELGKSNTLENTWVILTTDHGEMFERGIVGHLEPTFHQPLVHIPLLIFPPGQDHRIDIHTPTSAVDIIPTLLHLSGQEPPSHLEGQLLPPFLPNPDPNRPIYSMDARYSKQDGPFTTATVMLHQGGHKLIYFWGNAQKYAVLEGKERKELYDLEEDPEELTSRANTEPDRMQEMLNQILDQLQLKGVQ